MKMQSLPGMHRSAWILVLVFAISACSTTPRTSRDKPAPSARIEIQEAVGFAITETVAIGEQTRTEYDQAMAMLARGDRAAGIDTLTAAADRQPNLGAPRIDLGIAYHEAGDLENAERHLVMALETNPAHPVALTELGIVYRKTGRFSQARKSYEAALETYPGYHYARRNLGVLCDLYLDDLECALENYEAYMKTVPYDDEVAMWITDIKNRIQAGEG